MAQVRESDVATFQSEFTGTVFTSSHKDYDQARSVWNGDVNRHPAVIARCSTAEHVALALRFGRSQGVEISVRGGGHNFAGFAVCEGGLMIDLSGMRQVTIDPAARCVAAEPRGPIWMSQARPTAWP